MLGLRFLKTNAVFFLFLSSAVQAAPGLGSQKGPLVGLKKVQVTDGNVVDLSFDQKIREDQIKTEFFNDIIQLSLDGVSVYPAKISSVSGSDLTKVFAYQYSPRLVRCRLSIRGKAEEFQPKVRVKALGKSIRISIESPKDVVVVSHAKSQPTHGSKEAEVSNISQEEKALLDRVMKTEPAPSAPVEKSPEKQEKLGGAKPLPSPKRFYLVLLGLIGVLVATLTVVKWMGRGKGLDKHKGMGGLLDQFSKIGIPGLGKKRKMIEVVANHYLGPKKSIAVVNIGGKSLVLGVTQESINLITQIKDDQDPFAEEAILESLAKESIQDQKFEMNRFDSPRIQNTSVESDRRPREAHSFNQVFEKEAVSRPSSQIRSQIRQKMEGMKQL